VRKQPTLRLANLNYGPLKLPASSQPAPCGISFVFGLVLLNVSDDINVISLQRILFTEIMKMTCSINAGLDRFETRASQVLSTLTSYGPDNRANKCDDFSYTKINDSDFVTLKEPLDYATSVTTHKINKFILLDPVLFINATTHIIVEGDNKYKIIVDDKVFDFDVEFLSLN
jgi:hypothetical protein